MTADQTQLACSLLLGPASSCLRAAASAVSEQEGCEGPAVTPLTLAEVLTGCLRSAGGLLRRCLALHNVV